jgi:NAD-dependent dihydropyrimidine dehydrogenase PreA subunit
MTVTCTHHSDLTDTDRQGKPRHHGARILLQTPFYLKDIIKGDNGHPGIPGAQWSADHKRWHIPATADGALQLRHVLHDETLHVDEPTLRLLARAQTLTDAQAHKNPDGWHDLPDGPGRTSLWGHQRAGLHASLPRDGAGLGMDMGTGKSAVIVNLAECWDVRLAVIICPRKVLAVWPREFRIHGAHRPECPRALPQPPLDDDPDSITYGKFLPSTPGQTVNLVDPDEAAMHPCTCRKNWHVFNAHPRSDHPIRGKSGRILKNPSMKQRVDAARATLIAAARHGERAVLCFNYEAAWQDPIKTFLLDPLRGLPADVRDHYTSAPGCSSRIPYGLGATDEGHKVKKPGGKWSRFCHTLARRCARRVDATGTPMPHSEPDVYAQARFLDEGVFGTNYSKFIDRYFERGGFEDREIVGFRDQTAEAEFTRKLGELFFFCDAEDVLSLPPVMPEQTVTCRLSDATARQYDEMAEDFRAFVQGREVTAANALSRLLRLAQITSGHLPIDDDTGRRRPVTIGTEKRDLLRDTLEDIGAGRDEPVVVFGRFIHDLDVIADVARELGLRYGEVSGRRDDLTADGTMPDTVDLMGVQLQAGGVGVDLTRARYGVYYSLDFNLGNFQQSRKRIHRPGQNRPVHYVFLAAEGTVDEVIADALERREDVIASVIRAARDREGVTA